MTLEYLERNKNLQFNLRYYESNMKILRLFLPKYLHNAKPNKLRDLISGLRYSECLGSSYIF